MPPFCSSDSGAVGSFFLQLFDCLAGFAANEYQHRSGLSLNAFALYFGVLLALLSIAVFENHTRAEDAVVREAVSIIKLYRDLNGYPEPMRTQLSDTLHEYVDEAIGPGWVMQQRGEPNPKETVITVQVSSHDCKLQARGYRSRHPPRRRCCGR